jgi:hypothetical protein
MNQRYLFLLIMVMSMMLTANDCSISLEACWSNLEHSNTHRDVFGGQWILIGIITFRKKIKDDIKLEKLRLQWNGAHLTHLSGSLYKKIPDKKFLPIEENFLCDGVWNRAQQHLTLDFHDKKQTLGPLNIFYLVLTVPHAIEDTLKHGQFSLAKACLPQPFATQEKDLMLNIAQFIHTHMASATKNS